MIELCQVILLMDDMIPIVRSFASAALLSCHRNTSRVGLALVLLARRAR